MATLGAKPVDRAALVGATANPGKQKPKKSKRGAVIQPSPSSSSLPHHKTSKEKLQEEMSRKQMLYHRSHGLAK